jgi:predicted PurR-regulated permease PerM
VTEAAGPLRRAAPLLPVLLAAAVLFFLWRIADLLLVAFIAALLGVYLSGLTDLMCRWAKIPRLPGLLLALFLTLAALVGVGVLLAPAVAQQVQDLIAAVPRYLSALDRSVRDLAANFPVLGRTGIAESETGLVATALSDAIEFVRRSVFAYATVTGKIAIDAVAVIVMALYLAWRPALYLDGVVQLVPPRHRGVARAIADDLGATLRAWVGAQLLAMVVLATLTGIGLLLLGVPYWLAFAIFTGVAVMVPFFGTLVSTLLPALLVLPERGPLGFLAVAAVGVVVHVVEANLLHPLIMHHRVALPPVLTILSVLAMGTLAGLLGLVVAVPALATLFVLVRHVVIYEIYGERPHTAQPAVLRPTRSGAVRVVATPAS